MSVSPTLRGCLLTARVCCTIFTRRSQPELQQLRQYAKKKTVKRIELHEDEQALFDQEILQKDMMSNINNLKWEYTNSITTRITPAVIGNIQVGVDGRQLMLRDLAQISATNPQTIIVKLSSQTSSAAEVVKAVQNRMLVTASVDGTAVKLNIPKPSKELRDRLAKVAKEHAEKAKIGIRRTRQKAVSSVRKNKEGVSKDSIARIEEMIQNITDEHMGRVDQMLKIKTAELSKG